MVDEFSRFARMPKAVITDEDLADTVRQVVFLQRVGNADIDIDASFSHDPMPARFDRRLISQGLTNIIKNATEAIAAVPPAELDRGRIQVKVARDGGDIIVDVFDNGIGLPKDNRNRLLEPYVTTRERAPGSGSRSSAVSSKSTAAISSCATLRKRSRARAARGCNCALRRRRSRRPPRRRHRNKRRSDPCLPISSLWTTKRIFASW